MNKKNLLLSLLLTLFFIPFLSNAQQSSCTVRLREAQEQYDAGQIEAVPGLLHSCLQNGFTQEEKLQGYKLLINSYIFDDNLNRAEYYMLEFLKIYPEYKVTETDPYEFVSLLNQFGTKPRGSIGFSLGGIMPLVRVIEPFSTSPLSDIPSDYSFTVPGFRAGLSYNHTLGKWLELGLDPAFLQYTFDQEVKPFPFVRVESREVQGRIELPVSLILLFPGDKVNFYIRSGIKASYLIYGHQEMKRYYEDSPLSPVKGP